MLYQLSYLGAWCKGGVRRCRSASRSGLIGKRQSLCKPLMRDKCRINKTAARCLAQRFVALWKSRLGSAHVAQEVRNAVAQAFSLLGKL